MRTGGLVVRCERRKVGASSLTGAAAGDTHSLSRDDWSSLGVDAVAECGVMS